MPLHMSTRTHTHTNTQLPPRSGRLPFPFPTSESSLPILQVQLSPGCSGHPHCSCSLLHSDHLYAPFSTCMIGWPVLSSKGVLALQLDYKLCEGRNGGLDFFGLAWRTSRTPGMESDIIFTSSPSSSPVPVGLFGEEYSYPAQGWNFK